MDAAMTTNPHEGDSIPVKITKARSNGEDITESRLIERWRSG